MTLRKKIFGGAPQTKAASFGSLNKNKGH